MPSAEEELKIGLSLSSGGPGIVRLNNDLK